MYFVYILYCKSKNKYYVGHTNSISIRFKKHNAGEVRSTKYGIPWVLVAKFEFVTRSEAMKMEKKIKKRGIRRYLLDINFGV